jgi:3-deoxy-D-manno-octulosonic-acid transferase
MRVLYTLLFYLAVPLILVRLFWRGRRAPAYRRRWAERFGFFSASGDSPCVWVHAVSVGEVRAALPLIRALGSRYPRLSLMVTTTTPTGSEQVRRLFGNGVQHVYMPYDLPGPVRRFLRRARPRLGIVMETELWPNLFAACRCRGIPLVVANGRLSERSVRGYARVPGLSARTLACVNLIAAQSEADARRFRGLGAPPRRVRVVGNIKYDLQLPEALASQGRCLRKVLGTRRPVLIAASTHAGEEALLLDVHEGLRQVFPDLLLLLVPRHPERFAPVAVLCRERGLRVVLHSESRDCDPADQVFLGDTMGELLVFYGAADVAFVGGSLMPVGGHNVLEPALLGLPVLFGPHMSNFAEASQALLAAGAAWQVPDAAELAAKAQCLLADPARRRAMGRQGRAVVEENRGALARLLEGIEELMTHLLHN